MRSASSRATPSGPGVRTSRYAIAATRLTRRPPQHCGICVRTNAHWPYHRAPGGAPPAIEVMDGKEEVFVVEAQPGSVSAVASLESLDVLDKLPDSVVTPFAMDVMER